MKDTIELKYSNLHILSSHAKTLLGTSARFQNPRKALFALAVRSEFPFFPGKFMRIEFTPPVHRPLSPV